MGPGDVIAMIHPDQYRPAGTRNFIRVGDVVIVRPPERGSRFLAAITRIDALDDGTVTAVNLSVRSKLNGTDHPKRGSSRAVTPDRISRIAQTRVPERRPS